MALGVQANDFRITFILQTYTEDHVSEYRNKKKKKKKKKTTGSNSNGFASQWNIGYRIRLFFMESVTLILKAGHFVFCSFTKGVVLFFI